MRPRRCFAYTSKYPPAEPEALRLLAPQRGLIATGEKQKQLQRQRLARQRASAKTKATAGGILPEFSKFDCLPGRAGGTPISLERFSGLGFPVTVGFAGPESVITSLAGFGARRPQPLGGRTAIPAAFRYALAVSRRILVVCWIRRSDHPSRPRAKTCCFFSSFKTLAMPTEPTSLRRRQCPRRCFRWPVFR